MANGEYISRRNFLKIAAAAGGAAVGIKVFEKDINGFLYNLFNTESQPRTPPPVMNETVKPTVTPDYDYYDEDLKVGVEYIEPSIKTNVTNLIRTWKEVTPEDYRDKFPYAPKKIIRSDNSSFNYYGGASDNDFIKISVTTEKRGGSDDFKTQLLGVVDIEPEFRNAKQSKTGVKFSSGYESELDTNKWKANYAVKVGVWTQEQADRYIENVSKRINPDGTYKN